MQEDRKYNSRTELYGRENRPGTLSIAGFDPSGGAGILADIKTFEQLKVLGFAVNTGITIQTENFFHSVSWRPIEEILNLVGILLNEYNISVVKTGIFESLEYLDEVINLVKSWSNHIKIVVDPVIKSSTGFEFLKDHSIDNWKRILQNIDLLTPNIPEIISITGHENYETAAKEVSRCCNVFLKGGHSESKPGYDYLYTEKDCITFEPFRKGVSPKHGSGCVLSAAITANMANGKDLIQSCREAKIYTEKFLKSNETLLGYHAE